MNSVEEEFFVKRKRNPETKKLEEEVWMDADGRIVEYAGWDYRPDKMVYTREKYDPETGVRHAIGEPARTLTCLVSGVVFEEIYYFQDDPHREDGDAIIERNRVTGADIVRLRYLDGVQYEVTPEGMFPVIP